MTLIQINKMTVLRNQCSEILPGVSTADALRDKVESGRFTLWLEHETALPDNTQEVVTPASVGLGVWTSVVLSDGEKTGAKAEI